MTVRQGKLKASGPLPTAAGRGPADDPEADLTRVTGLAGNAATRL